MRLARSGTLAVDVAAVIGTQRRVLGRTRVFPRQSPTYIIRLDLQLYSCTQTAKQTLNT